jgi:hypothetical protein
VVHHVAVEHVFAGEVEEARAEGEAAIAWDVHRVHPYGLRQRLAIDLGHLHIIGVDVEDVVVLVLIDDRPFFHRAEAHSLIDPIWIENLAVDQEPEFLPMLRRLDLGMRR